MQKIPEAPADAPEVVLIVDDDPSMQTLLGLSLAMNGFSPQHALHVGQAIDIAERYRVALVILDVDSDVDENVSDFVAWLRLQPRYRLTPVIALTTDGRCFLNEASECPREGVFALPHSALPIHVVTQVRDALATVTTGSQ
jgi:CheY-like chemotaxis protein